MAFKRILIACLTAAVCFASPVMVFAEETDPYVTGTYGENLGNPDEPNDVNLITSYSLYCYKSSNTIYITSSTIGNKILAENGITNIQVQRSINGVSGWETCIPQFKLTETYAVSCYVNDYPVQVESGYYYRVVVTHYAKETGFWFPKSQSIQQTSGVM